MPSMPGRTLLPSYPQDWTDPRALEQWGTSVQTTLANIYADLAYRVNATVLNTTVADRAAEPVVDECFHYATDTGLLSAAVNGAWVPINADTFAADFNAAFASAFPPAFNAAFAAAHPPAFASRFAATFPGAFASAFAPALVNGLAAISGPVAVPAGTTSMSIPVSEPNTNYIVFLTPSGWYTRVSYSFKTTSSFLIGFETAPVSPAFVDILLIRQP